MGILARLFGFGPPPAFEVDHRSVRLGEQRFEARKLRLRNRPTRRVCGCGTIFTSAANESCTRCMGLSCPAAGCGLPKLSHEDSCGREKCLQVRLEARAARVREIEQDAARVIDEANRVAGRAGKLLSIRRSANEGGNRT